MQNFLKQTITQAGALAKEYYIKGVEFKTKAHLGDLVTEADLAVEKFLISSIQRRFPGHHIHSEESVSDINPGAEYEWLIDPIDGTRNFANGIPMWCVMVAAYQAGEPLLAAVCNPLGSELWLAARGQGATLNGLPIRVNDVAVLDHSFGCPVRGINTTHEDRFNRFLCRLAKETTAWMHNFGTVLAACYVASGGMDWYAVNCGYDHDYAAAALIAAEAGALVTDCDGLPWARGRRDIVIANPKIHPQLLALLR